ncbi:MAG: hypothetical protein LBR71_07175, partial [Synergistaceae bacterium]|nr:hypothetical protein [Synergistaceae bacterium]
MPAILLAGALFFGAQPAFFKTKPASALTVQGAPAWLDPHVLRGIQAVWERIPPGDFRLETLSLVAKRLFTGYGVTVDGGSGGPRVVLTPLVSARWSVALTPPDLRSPSSFWFEGDIRGMGEEIAPLLEGLPVEALSWADAALREKVGEIVKRR